MTKLWNIWYIFLGRIIEKCFCFSFWEFKWNFNFIVGSSFYWYHTDYPFQWNLSVLYKLLKTYPIRVQVTNLFFFLHSGNLETLYTNTTDRKNTYYITGIKDITKKTWNDTTYRLTIPFSCFNFFFHSYLHVFLIKACSYKIKIF